MRSEFLPFHKQTVGEREIEAVVNALKSPWITSGPQVQQLEKDFASYVGCKFAVAVNSCTAALHLALDAIGLKEGDEVLVPTMTFAATAETVLYFQAKPILVDVDRTTQHIDLADARKKITSKTKAIMPVHVAGLACDMPAISEFAKVYRLRVIEDAAHAFPTKSRGKWIGAISDATCFSFYATKTITTGEGGMLTTDDEAIAKRARIMRTHGLDRDAYSRSNQPDSWAYDIVEPGFKYNMTDVAAAMGVVQLSRAEEFRLAREKIAAQYSTELSGISGLLLPPEPPQDDLHSWHLYTIRLDLEKTHIRRNELTRSLRQRNIGTSVHWIPLHLHTYYRERLGYRPEDLPNGSWLAERIFSLPIFPSMTAKDVGDVCETLRESLNEKSH